VSEVEFFEWRRAPQITTLFLERSERISFMFVGSVELACLPKNCIMNFAFILVARIPAAFSSWLDFPSCFNAEMYFLAMTPPPQTITNLCEG